MAASDVPQHQQRAPVVEASDREAQPAAIVQLEVRLAHAREARPQQARERRGALVREQLGELRTHQLLDRPPDQSCRGRVSRQQP